MLAFVGGGVVGGTVGTWLAVLLSKQQRTLHYVFFPVLLCWSPFTCKSLMLKC
ncbi:hypothetical protein [Peribacillus simplex]|uniref:hypothetical protein n=1 Tax=Peribacillus simplex TaxID=1478 RepID=UPI0014853034|nr:hypothetical protein [Peribacillus simplex]